MKFLWSQAPKNILKDQLTIHELCNPKYNLPIDGAVADINCGYGPKINHTFTILFFVLEGELLVCEANKEYILQKNDMCIIKKGVKHLLVGNNCRVFISCSPPYNVKDVSFDEKHRNPKL